MGDLLPIEVTVALITATGVGTAAVIPALLQRGRIRRVDQNLGSPVEGSLVTMVAEVLRHVRENTLEITHLKERQEEQGKTMKTLGDEHREHMDAITKLGDDHVELRDMVSRICPPENE